MLAPVGGGGLLSGLCFAAQALRPRMAIFASDPAGALDAMDSVKQNHIIPPMPNPNTHADGLRTSLGELILPILLRHVAGYLAVGEEEILQAMQFAYERLKLVIELSSAVALVPLLRRILNSSVSGAAWCFLGAMWSGYGPGQVWTGPRLCSEKAVSGSHV